MFPGLQSFLLSTHFSSSWKAGLRVAGGEVERHGARASFNTIRQCVLVAIEGIAGQVDAAPKPAFIFSIGMVRSKSIEIISGAVVEDNRFSTCVNRPGGPW